MRTVRSKYCKYMDDSQELLIGIPCREEDGMGLN